MQTGRPERQCVDALKRRLEVVVISKCDVELESAERGVRMNDERTQQRGLCGAEGGPTERHALQMRHQGGRSRARRRDAQPLHGGEWSSHSLG